MTCQQRVSYCLIHAAAPIFLPFYEKHGILSKIKQGSMTFVSFYSVAASAAVWKPDRSCFDCCIIAPVYYRS